MNVFALISLTAFMVCFFLGNFIYHKNPKSELNIMIALLCILVGLLAFIEYEYRQAETIQTAFFWLKISSLWPLVPSFLMHISLIFTKSKFLKYKLTYILMYLPAILIIILALTTNLMIYQVFQEYYGWYFTAPPDGTLYDTMAFWSILGGFLSGLICLVYYLKSRDLKRKQAKYVFVGLYMPLLISLATDFILPTMSVRVPEMTMTMSTVGIGFISYGIWKYRFPALTAAVAADRIVSTMSNFLLLLDKDRNIININQATSNLLGYDSSELAGKPVEVIFPAQEKDSLSKYFDQLMEKLFIKNKETCFLTKNGEIIPVLLSISLIQTKEKKVIGIVCIGSDITDITKAKNEIQSSLDEKELLLQEVHHRVKNNLQVISSLLNLQSQYISNEKDLELFKDSQSRVRSMAFIHEQIYQSSNFSSIEFSVYIQNLVSYLSHYYAVNQNNIKLDLNIEDLSLDLNTSIPVGLIVNELVTNSLKHAFPNNRGGEIYIDLHSLNDHQYKLIVEDNGIGLPENFDFENAQTLGLQLVNGLVSQLDGTLKIEDSNSTKFEIIFNKLEYSDRI